MSIHCQVINTYHCYGIFMSMLNSTWSQMSFFPLAFYTWFHVKMFVQYADGCLESEWSEFFFFFNKTVLSITVCCMVFKLKAFFPTIVSCVYPCQDLIILLTKINKERVLAVFFFIIIFWTQNITIASLTIFAKITYYTENNRKGNKVTGVWLWTTGKICHLPKNVSRQY